MYASLCIGKLQRKVENVCLHSSKQYARCLFFNFKEIKIYYKVIVPPEKQSLNPHSWASCVFILWRSHTRSLLNPACPKEPIHLQPSTVVDKDDLNHALRDEMLATSVWSESACSEEAVIGGRQRQGDERHKAGLLDGWEMMRGERGTGTRLLSLLLSLLPSFICVVRVRVFVPHLLSLLIC